MSKLLIFLGAFTAFATAATNSQGYYCSGPILANDTCCVNGVRIDDATGGTRCDEYGSAAFRSVPARATSLPILLDSDDIKAKAGTSPESLNNKNEDETPKPSTVLPKPPPATPAAVLTLTGPSPTPTPPPTTSELNRELKKRQDATISYPNGYGGYGTVSFPLSSIISNPYNGGYESYGPNGYVYEGPGASISAANGGLYGTGGYYAGNGYGGCVGGVCGGYNGNGVYGGGYGGGYGLNGYNGEVGDPVGYTARVTYVTAGPDGPYTATKIFRAEATGRPKVVVGFVGGLGLIGGLVGWGLV